MTTSYKFVQLISGSMGIDAICVDLSLITGFLHNSRHLFEVPSDRLEAFIRVVELLGDDIMTEIVS